MPTTVINVNAVEESTTRALRFVAEQQTALDSIDRVINSMEDAWDSDAQRAYAESYRLTRGRIDRFNQSVTESVDNIRHFVDDCVSADELTAREILSVTW